MLGAVKIKGDADAGIPLFRILARRWKPVIPLPRRRVEIASMLPADPQPVTERKWISKPRRLPVVAPPREPAQRPSWNPWLWMK
jgi:hypothetical protein